MQGIQKTINSTQRDADLFIDNAVFFLRKIQGNGLCPNIHEYFFRLILDEAIQNSIHHGNAGDPCKTIYITITPSSQFITITVRDEGKGFSPQEVSDPRSPENITRPGGRGIHLIKNFGRACWNNEGNEITIILEEGTAADAN
ncbi:MAG TPA: ATP-binding protein [Spirochaetota bacterium]|nr:ATP-binding protein [Spirochaetota bacterium]HPJ37309.1 ATP-binding protein [Spirochaetota bacterium]HPQ53107.1 ATP-binding protein [Spirochaetota bacterium]